MKNSLRFLIVVLAASALGVVAACRTQYPDPVPVKPTLPMTAPLPQPDSEQNK